MTEVENQLIQQYKDDFRLKVGKIIEVRVGDKWDELCSFDVLCPFWKIVQMIIDATGWSPKITFAKIRNEERVARRHIIDLISLSNGKTLTEIGRETNRNHTSVLHSVREARENIERDIFHRKFMREIISYIRENYQFYRDKTITKEDVFKSKNNI